MKSFQSPRSGQICSNDYVAPEGADDDEVVSIP